MEEICQAFISKGCTIISAVDLSVAGLPYRQYQVRFVRSGEDYPETLQNDHAGMLERIAQL